MLHDLAISSLFSHITVYFGLWHDYATMEWTDEMEEEVHLKSNITWDILRHISLSPDFAQVVKKITVKSYLSHGVLSLRALLSGGLNEVQLTCNADREPERTSDSSLKQYQY